MSTGDTTIKRPLRFRPATAERRVLALTVVAHADPARVGDLAIANGSCTRLSRLEPELARPGDRDGAPLDDRGVSRQPVRIELAGAGVVIAPPAADVDVRVGGRRLVAPVTLAASDVDRGVVIELGDRAALLLHRRVPPHPGPELGLGGASDAVARLRDRIRHVARARTPVYVCGETGSGKELVAEAIHRESGRTGPFVAVNMATVTPTTAVSQLFGHVRGAFTSAAATHRGLFAAADGGTLLLDEVAECTDDVQAMLLRVLETGEVVPLGGERGHTVDVRVIAATDRDLEALVRAGQFRAPLWHRLAGAIVEVPPLRARRDDVARLLFAFLADELAACGESERLAATPSDREPWIPPALIAALCAYDWPGNVRELRNVARRLVLASRGLDELVIDDELVTRFGLDAADHDRGAVDDLPAILERNAWRIGATAAELGISRTTLYHRIEGCAGIRKAGDLPADELAPLVSETGRDLDAMAGRLRVSRRGLQLRLRELGL